MDTSVLVAILLKEPDHEYWSDLLARAPRLFIGAPTLVELHLVTRGRVGNPADILISTLLARYGIRTVAFSLAHANAASEAFDRYGKGRHSARLNFGDCPSYALARVQGLPLLWKGGDFDLTDATRASPTR